MPSASLLDEPTEGCLRLAPHVCATRNGLAVAHGSMLVPAASRARAYVLEATPEERAVTPATRAFWSVGRLLRRASRRLLRREPRPSRASVLSDRWIEGAWRGGAIHPAWLTLHGTSMSPTIRDGARILAAAYAAGETPAAGDIVITHQAGRLVAHRLVARAGHLVVTRGDACRSDDPVLPISEVLAKVVAVYQ
jgi:hypothetical protein